MINRLFSAGIAHFDEMQSLLCKLCADYPQASVGDKKAHAFSVMPHASSCSSLSAKFGM